MNHIREYNNYGNISTIEELSEYLQEIFDKYQIVEAIESYDGSFFHIPKTQFWYIHAIKDGYNIVSSCIIIANISHLSIYDDIVQIKPNIEKRLGQEIHISNPKGYITINV